MHRNMHENDFEDDNQIDPMGGALADFADWGLLCGAVGAELFL